MALTSEQAVEYADHLYGVQGKERFQLDTLRRYVTGRQAMPLVVPSDAPMEVREMARISRINLIKIVVESLVESLYVDNFRSVDYTGAPEDDPAQKIWQVWQTNRLDRAQSGLYRAVFTYGWGFMRVTPGTDQRTGEDRPVVRPLSPRVMTALYEDDNDDWPAYTLERRRRGRNYLYELTDDEGLIYTLAQGEKGAWAVAGEPLDTGLGYNPTVRYTDVVDLDLDDEPESQMFQATRDRDTCVVAGQVAPLMTLQDQADMTTFALKAAEWYSAFRQRWIKGWTPANRAEKLRTGASQLWAFDDAPDDIALGEFSQTDLSGYINSRQETAKFTATLSQTPVHELIGELVNLSAEALAAAEAGRDRKLEERKTGEGESHEQLAQCIGDYIGVDVPSDFEVVWRDTSARAFAAVVDGLGKLAQMLQIPPEELWDRVPGATRQDVQRWKTAAKEGDALGNLTALLDRQAAGANPGTPQPGETTTPSGLILPAGTRTA